MPNAQISSDRFHVVALANRAMDEVRSSECKADSQRVRDALGALDARERHSILWALRRNPATWSERQSQAMNGPMQQAKRAARGFRTATSFIAIAYLRLAKLTHLPASPFVQAMPLAAGQTMRAA